MFRQRILTDYSDLSESIPSAFVEWTASGEIGSRPTNQAFIDFLDQLAIDLAGQRQAQQGSDGKPDTVVS